MACTKGVNDTTWTCPAGCRSAHLPEVFRVHISCLCVPKIIKYTLEWIVFNSFIVYLILFRPRSYVSDWYDINMLRYRFTKFVFLNFSRKEKYLLKWIFVSVLLLLCFKMLIFVRIYINSCVFTSTCESCIRLGKFVALSWFVFLL